MKSKQDVLPVQEKQISVQLNCDRNQVLLQCMQQTDHTRENIVLSLTQCRNEKGVQYTNVNHQQI